MKVMEPGLCEVAPFVDRGQSSVGINISRFT